MSDDDERLRLASLQNRLEKQYQLADRFGREDESAITALQAEIASIPAHIREEDALNKKRAALDGAVRAYISRRRLRKRPRVDDIWLAVQGFEQEIDALDKDGSTLIASTLCDLRHAGISEDELQKIVLKADKSV